MNDDSSDSPQARGTNDDTVPRSERPGLSADIVCAAEVWTELGDVADLVTRATSAVARGLADGRVTSQIVLAGSRASSPSLEAVVALSDDAEVATLNATYRGIDKPTNVLSFPAPKDVRADAGLAAPTMAIGDIVLAYETVAREAAELAIPLAHHLQHLVIHGLLHLLGYDHEIDTEAEAMEALETRLLADLGIPDPYQDNRPDDAPASPADESPMT